MISSTDQLNRTIFFSGFPQRIISVVPSQTELLYSLGLKEEVIGITKFCVHPDEWFRNKTRVGGTKKLNIGLIRSLKPDLIIANKEENTKEDIDLLIGEFPMWISDIKTFNDSINMIKEVGRITNREQCAIELSEKIIRQFNSLKSITQKITSCIYLLWKNPFMVAGNDTFISEMLTRGGFKNLITENRYPKITSEQITHLKPEVILLSSEPFPYKQKDVNELKLFFPRTNVLCVDGEMFSWYGSRLLLSPEYFANIKQKLLNNHY